MQEERGTRRFELERAGGIDQGRPRLWRRVRRSLRLLAPAGAVALVGVLAAPALSPLASSPSSRIAHARLTAASAPVASPYFPVTPVRVVDTRCSASPKPTYCTSESIPGQNAALAPLVSGFAWSAPAFVDSAAGITSVSCPTASFCMAVDADGNALSFDGSSWSAPVSVDPGGNLNAVSCPTASFCMALDQGGDALEYNGTSWSSPSAIDPNRSFTSVSCPTASFCMAVAYGDALSFDGSTWSAPVSVDTNGDLSAVSCPSASFCVALDYSGYALDYEGSSWGGFHLVDASGSSAGLTSVSCPSASACTAVDGVGNALYYEPADNPTDTAQVAGVDGIPSGATDVVMNVTVAQVTTGGFLTVYPAGESPPVASNLNFTPGMVVANLVEVPLSSSGQVDFTLGGANGSTEVIADIEGYVAAGTSGSPGDTFDPMAPERIVDTRCFSSSYESSNAAYCQSVPNQVSPASSIPAHSSATIKLPSALGSASAVVANLTVTGTSAGGFLTAYPAGQSLPPSSNLNFTAGQTVANRIEVPVSSGSIEVYNGSTSPVDVVIDVSGTYTSASGGSDFVGVSPQRILDTRCAASPQPSYCSSEALPEANAMLGQMSPGTSITVQVGGTAAVPSAATAVVANLTAVGPTGPGFLTVYPSGSAQPTISDVNFPASVPAVPNLTVVSLPSSGSVVIYNGSSGTVNVLLDVVGYFTG